MESGFLRHYSEDPGIRRFVPRPVSADPGSLAIVWAIDERHAVNYFSSRMPKSHLPEMFGCKLG